MIKFGITIFGRKTLLPASVSPSPLDHPTHAAVPCFALELLRSCVSTCASEKSCSGTEGLEREVQGGHPALLPSKTTGTFSPGEAQEAMGCSSDGFQQQKLLFRHILHGKAMETGPTLIEGGMCMCTCVHTHLHSWA